MKTQSNNLLETLSYEDVKILTGEVKETLFLDLKKEIKNFTAAQLWKIQRQRKNGYDRRFYSI